MLLAFLAFMAALSCLVKESTVAAFEAAVVRLILVPSEALVLVLPSLAFSGSSVF